MEGLLQLSDGRVCWLPFRFNAAHNSFNIIAAKSKRWRIYYIANYILSVAVLFLQVPGQVCWYCPFSCSILIALKDRRAIKPVVASILGISVLTVYLIRSDYNAILRAFGIRSAGDRFIEKWFMEEQRKTVDMG